jgi:zinc protease
VANLLAETMTQGTRTKTPAQLEKAIDLLGASIRVSAGAQSFEISGSTLARNYAATMALVEEILLEPRFDAEEFELARQRVRNGLRQRASSPTGLAADTFNELLYGDHILASNAQGTIASVDAISLDALKAYYARALTPALADVHVVGAVTQAEVATSLKGVASRWQGAAGALPAPPTWNPARAGLYFVDVPNASQSVLRIGYLALAESDAADDPATVMNFRLGGGGFASDLTQTLREERGYTYGISSAFGGTDMPGPFQIASSVRSNVTLEALQAIKTIVQAHGPEFDADDLEATRSFLLRANARAFESPGAKLGLLEDMSLYGFPADYVIKREQIVRDMTIPRIRQLASQYLAPEKMVWLVVGDARTQLPRLAALGFGRPTVISPAAVAR